MNGTVDAIASDYAALSDLLFVTRVIDDRLLGVVVMEYWDWTGSPSIALIAIEKVREVSKHD